jgi:hypothetical protein
MVSDIYLPQRARAKKTVVTRTVLLAQRRARRRRAGLFLLYPTAARENDITFLFLFCGFGPLFLLPL